MRARHIAVVALVLGLTVTAFIVARADTGRDARRDSERRAEVAAAQIRDRIEQATSLTQSLRSYMLDAGGTGVTSDQFTRNALRWLSPAHFPAAAWAEQVQAADRTEYERRTGQPIVIADEPNKRAPPSSSYMPATLVSGFTPLDLRGVDLRREPGIAAALLRATSPGGVVATPISRGRTRASGLFLVTPAPNLIDGVLRPGAVAVFVPEATLRASASDPAGLRLVSAGRSSGAASGNTVRKGFFAAGRGFAVVMPKESVSGPSAALPWIILAGGLVLSALVAGLGVIAGRRAKAQAEVDRIFNLSSDLIAVADFEGHFKRVNPAVEQVLGYTPQEFLAMPYLELVHPEDRESTAAEAEAIGRGKKTLSFENRYRHKDGSYRTLEWTATPVVEDGLMYGVARNITERREADAERARLADDQAALRRVATLVAEGVPRAELFSAVSKEVGRLFGTDMAAVGRFDRDGSAHVVVGLAKSLEGVTVGSRWELDDSMTVAQVYRSRRSARRDEVDWSTVRAPIGEAGRRLGTVSGVSSPIIVDGRLWGAISVSARQPLPPYAEQRLERFTGLVGTAIANAESREALGRLADEQAALRRVATLVAEGVEPAELFSAVTQEVARLFVDVESSIVPSVIRFDPGPQFVLMGASEPMLELPVGSRWGPKDLYVSTRVLRTERSARVDAKEVEALGGPDADLLRRQGFRYQVGSPIVVEGRLWGAITMNSREALPPDSDERLESFTELVATAIANAESGEALGQLADEQAALRRVATLVAREASQEEVFGAIAEEIGRLLGTEEMRMLRYEEDGSAVVLGSSGDEGAFPIGSRHSLEADSAASRVFRTGHTVRIDNYRSVSGQLAETARSIGIQGAVGAPILVQGRLWGAMVAATTQDKPQPQETESRLGQFTELMATAIANTQARGEVERLAEEQAALRRVATLVAEGASPSAVLDAVAGEMEELLNADQVALNRYEPGDEILVLAHRGLNVARTPVGSRVSHRGESVTATVRRTGRPARMENFEGVPGALAELARATGERSSVGAPIVVNGRLWGIITASWKGEESPPTETEERMVHFAELLDTAIANADARAEVERLAEEQAALRRVATLVAHGAPPSAVLDAVAAEMERLLGADGVTLSRYEPDEQVSVVAHSGSDPRKLPAGTRVSHRGENVTSWVRRSQRSARMEHRDETHGVAARLTGSEGVRASVGAPIIVDGQLWGVAIANWRGEESPSADTEERMAQFAELLDTAIANADSRDQLTASRARLVTEADDARRRVVRDLHDGAQQRLVHAIVTLKLAKRALKEDNGKLESLMGEALEQAEQGNRELRELAHGILPSVLSRGGLRAAVGTVVQRLDVPVEVDIQAGRFPAEIEASAYFVVAEALTNVMKHSRAQSVAVKAFVQDGILQLEVRDDGIGGADPNGHGLVGINDRLTALGGRLEIHSPARGGTFLVASLPLPADGAGLRERPSPRSGAAP